MITNIWHDYFREHALGIIVYFYIPFAFATQFLNGAPYHNCGMWPSVQIIQIFPFWPTLAIYALSFLPALLIAQRINETVTKKGASSE